ncbi:MAG: hypothetical protein KF814_01190 [Nitrospiraceae bacterium]|nr:hypothetical protein [Nitrospiraceae bacterium]
MGAMLAAAEPRPPATGNQPEQNPSTAPPSIDPGIVQHPKTLPSPDSVVVPPEVDRRMTVDPETRKRRDPDVSRPDNPTRPVPMPPAPPDPIPMPPRTPSPSP